jgi:hypothetical protein
MTTVTSTRLRPMSDAERTAVDMYDEARSMEEICDATGLTRPQVAAAVELRDKFEAIITPDGTAPVAIPVEAAPVTAKPAVSAAPNAPVKPTPAAPKDDVDTLLAAGVASPQPRARELAGQIRDGIATLRTLIGNDEKFRTLTALVEVHRRHLAETEAELAALIGADSAPAVDDRPAIVIDVEPFRETETAAPALKKSAPIRKPDPLAYSPEVRAWARSHGWPGLGTYGRMPAAIVTAWLNAHPDASAT